MELLKINFNAKHYSYKAEDKIGRSIYEQIKDKENIVILCIGTNKINGDSLGPTVGTFLEENNISNVYGTLENPVDATNLKEKINEIKSQYDNPYIIAIDAAVYISISNLIGKPEALKTILIEDKSMTARSWDKKNAVTVGNLSITGIVEYGSYYNFQKRMESSDLGMIYNISKIIAKSLIRALNQL